jgi:predicted nucleic acid-binding protein
MSGKVFVDTNILVYAHDLDAGIKNVQAKRLLARLWEDRTGVLSTQVLQEFIVAVTKKPLQPIGVAQARGIVRDYCAWDLVINDSETILQATEIQEAHKLSFWDELIIAAAFAGNAATLATEDLNHGQLIEGIRIENPFVEALGKED